MTNNAVEKRHRQKRVRAALPLPLPKGKDSYSSYVAHIKDPSTFYVHDELFKSTEKEFGESCKAAAMCGSKPQHIVKDQLYLVHLPAKNGWFRATVVQYNIFVDRYQVQFVDYGFTDTVPANR